LEYLIIFISVFVVALVFSMFGMGGGLIYMPLFLLFIDNYKVASILSFSCISVTAFTAMSVYHREKLIDWTLFGYLGVPLVVMVFLTGVIINIVPILFIKVILGMTLGFAGILMVFTNNNLSISGVFAKKYQYPPIYFSPATAAIGILSGMSGVAGGVFEIPLMTTILHVPAHTAVATSSAIVFVASILGFTGRIIANHQNIDIHFSWIVCILFCAFLGGRLGPKISLNISKQKFKKFCGVFVLFIGIYYILQVFK